MSRSRRLLAGAALGLVIFVAACASGPGLVRQPDSVVVTIPLSWSNAYLILGERPILVDPGSPGDEEALGEALAAYDVAWEDLALIIVTHGHADHAGAAAAAVARSGAPLLAGAADRPLLTAGDGGRLKAQGFEARMIQPFVPKQFPAVTPTLELAEAPGRTSLDLRAYGVSGEAVLTPGHTEGSLVVLLDGGEAIVGDLFRGGVFGGRMDANTPHRHYFHANAEQAEGVVPALLRRGVTRFYLGHGGPVSSADAQRRFAPRNQPDPE
ncbi:MAG: MBL fold metallo-hydrolase [Bacteroidota bacterium]